MNVIETLCIVVVFAAIFIFGEKLHIGYQTHKRRALSAAGGAAVAYVFIHLLPEMDQAGREFVKITADWSQIWYPMIFSLVSIWMLFFRNVHT